ncbi:sensor histidine kinase, partial [Enterococcus faecium]|uniref:sensor histidine kinase n=1 Tax=Enterococcus faecium TaxID=1352 RepID=UPI0034E93B42
IEIAGRDAGDAVEFAVTDSGRGIPMAIREKIFDPFFTMKAVGKGSGLGLSLARTIVVDHGGSLVIDETCPHTRFVVRIPKKSPAAAKGAA